LYSSLLPQLVVHHHGRWQWGTPQPISEAARILGERIPIRRMKLACSHEEISHLAGMNVSNFGKIERGLGNPNFRTIVRIASVLGMDSAVLVVVLVAGIGVESLPDLAETYTAADFVRERRRRQQNGG
jgi:transcriptional regulator with XRE-family HTH domain